MKPIPKNFSTTQSQKILTALILTGIVSVGSGLALIKSSVAADTRFGSETAKQSLKENATSDRLPSQVANAVLRSASEASRLPRRALNIVTFTRTQWASGCEKPTFPRPCDPVLVPGWEVIVGAGDNRWVYLTNQDGSQIKLSEKGTQGTLPKSISSKILVDASQWSGLSTEALRIVKVESQTWANPCMFAFGQICTREYNPVSGWEVTVDSGTQKWVYRVDDKATSVLLDRTRSLTPKAAEAIKKDAAKFSASSNLRIIAVERRDDWNGSCEGVPNCTRPIAPGWQATVSNGRDSYVYRVKEDGSQFELQGHNGNNQTLKPVPIPANELPPPLDRNVVFREISSGGFTARIFETVLLNDGRLIRTRVGDANDSERNIRRLSRQQVRQFQQLLERQRFAQFKNLNYASKTGCCDIPAHTLTSRDGTVRYNQIPLDSLPANLRAVVEAWNQIRGSARGIGE
ncbi:MAG TPA: hypothetical protein V6D14_19285 [Coleofasciculaceae cyanobacterium]|jgi:hypothetical protein